MSIALNYKDSVDIVKPVIDEYSSPKIGQVETVDCLFISRTSSSHGNNQDAIDSDAALYIDPNNTFVLDNFDRLEEMLIIAPRFGSSESESWYKIINVSVGEDKLLNNQIDNILLRLKKTTGITYVS